MNTLYRLELLLALRGKALPGTRSRIALDRLVREFYEKIEREMASDLANISIREVTQYEEAGEVE